MRFMKYKGFTITEIYQSADGKGNHDYSIVPAIRKDIFIPERGEVKMKTTVEKIKSLIDKI